MTYFVCINVMHECFQPAHEVMLISVVTSEGSDETVYH